jgi:hypothetical protein
VSKVRRLEWSSSVSHEYPAQESDLEMVDSVEHIISRLSLDVRKQKQKLVEWLFQGGGVTSLTSETSLFRACSVCPLVHSFKHFFPARRRPILARSGSPLHLELR